MCLSQFEQLTSTRGTVTESQSSSSTPLWLAPVVTVEAAFEECLYLIVFQQKSDREEEEFPFTLIKFHFTCP